MILIADSGSTKCDWIAVNKDSRTEFKTQGFNPMFHTASDVELGIRKNPPFAALNGMVKEVFYYGAGCQNQQLNKIIERGISAIFAEAKVHVDHDLTAAVRATCNDQPGIACILGTGSNITYFDGAEVHSKVSGLGYILGDEGSGSYFGKRMLSDFLYEIMPIELRNKFIEEYGVDKENIIASVYMKPNANVYLASFMKFFSIHADEPYVQEVVEEGFDDFVRRHVLRFENHARVPVHFVGSVAHHFSNRLETVLKRHGLEMGQIIKKPIESLLDYHQSHRQKVQ